mmetsp:Transcript_110069/g.350610  ORF Transcript_110069/g.350610 Transcript_110069/m.350610 type:complete len:208 (+) Transcript_110069:525-1148(+)
MFSTSFRIFSFLCKSPNVSSSTNGNCSMTRPNCSSMSAEDNGLGCRVFSSCSCTRISARMASGLCRHTDGKTCPCSGDQARAPPASKRPRPSQGLRLLPRGLRLPPPDGEPTDGEPGQFEPPPQAPAPPAAGTNIVAMATGRRPRNRCRTPLPRPAAGGPRAERGAAPSPVTVCGPTQSKIGLPRLRSMLSFDSKLEPPESQSPDRC